MNKKTIIAEIEKKIPANFTEIKEISKYIGYYNGLFTWKISTHNSKKELIFILDIIKNAVKKEKILITAKKEKLVNFGIIKGNVFNFIN